MARDIQINIGARDSASRVIKGVTGAVGKLEGVGRAIGRSMIGIGVAAAGAATTVGIAMKQIVGDFAEAGDLIHKTALRTKLSAEFLSELGFAAEQSGTSLDQMSQAMFRAFRRIGNAETMTGPAARAVKELGINAKELAQLEPEQMFFELVDAINAVEDPLRRSQMGFELFGDNWRQIAPLIEQGRGEIRRLMEEGRDLGVTMTGEMAQGAADYTDAMNRLYSSLKGLRNLIGAELAPAFTKLADTITMAIQNAGLIMDGFRLKILDLNISILQMLDSAERMIPFYAGSTTPDAINILQGQRAGIIADLLRGVVAEIGPAVASSMFSVDDKPNQYAARAAGGGPERLFKEIGEIGKFFSPRVSPELQATSGRLLARGPGATQAAEQGKQMLAQMQRLEDLLANGGPGGGIPVRDVGAGANEFEMVKAV